jgi:SAM-dependent methyltransferase
MACVGAGKSHSFHVRRGVPFLIQGHGGAVMTAPETSNVFGWLKECLKRYPGLYTFLTQALGPTLLVDRTKVLLRMVGAGDEKTVLNLGSGVRILGDAVVNVDRFAFKGVHLVADLEKLPFADQSVDGVVSEYVLEHVANPAAVIREMGRVLRPAGLIYVAVPFLEPFHPAPNDYFRWTKHGLLEQLADYDKVEVGIAEGPTGAMIWILQEWLSIVCSLGWKPLYHLWTVVFMIVFCPLKILDIALARIPFAHHIAGAMYFIGRKK